MAKTQENSEYMTKLHAPSMLRLQIFAATILALCPSITSQQETPLPPDQKSKPSEKPFQPGRVNRQPPFNGYQ